MRPVTHFHMFAKNTRPVIDSPRTISKMYSFSQSPSVGSFQYCFFGRRGGHSVHQRTMAVITRLSAAIGSRNFQPRSISWS